MQEPTPMLRTDSDGLCTLTLNRPDSLNALNTAMFEILDEQLDALSGQTDAIGCVLIRGAGRSFCAGADLKDVATGKAKTAIPYFKPKTLEKIAKIPQPVVAAVHGHCYTGGLELVLACDLIVASDSARFADTHGKFGMVGGWGLSQRLPRKIGTMKALEMMFTGATFGARQAYEMGLVNACFTESEFDAAVDKFCRKILANSWHSNFGYKRLIRETAELPLSAGLAYELYNHPGRAADFAERVSSFGK